VTAERVRREFDADIEWLPFDLHPEYPTEGIPLADLHRRYGIGTGADDPLNDRFAEAGLTYNRPDVVPNTRLALRMSELARDAGLHDAFHDRLMDAYWSEATDIGDPDQLRRLAAEVGLEADGVEQVIADGSLYLGDVQQSTHQAQSVGINAIPAFVLDRRLIVLGAHPIETFRSAFAQLAADAPQPGQAEA
jgi:predicted DsbA family dithiol-disulfide isomerase